MSPESLTLSTAAESKGTLFFLHEYQDEVSEAAVKSSRVKENNGYRHHHSWRRALGRMGVQKLSARHHGNADVKLQILGAKGEEGESGRKAGVPVRS